MRFAAGICGISQQYGDADFLMVGCQWKCTIVSNKFVGAGSLSVPENVAFRMTVITNG